MWCMTVIKVRTLRWYQPGLGWAPNPKNSVLVRDRKGETETHRVKGHVNMEAGLEWCDNKPRNIKDCHLPPKARKQVWNGFSLRASTRKQPCQHLLFRTSCLQNCERINLVFDPPRLWSFVMAVLGSSEALWREMSIKLLLQRGEVICSKSLVCKLVRLVLRSRSHGS